MESDINELCPDCNKPYTGTIWCKECNAKWFKQDFSNWTSGNEFIDKFIQETQLNACNGFQVLESIPYEKLGGIEFIDKGGFITVYKANWSDGPIKSWSINEKKWIRYNKSDVALKIESLNNSSNLSEEFLNEVSIIQIFC